MFVQVEYEDEDVATFNHVSSFLQRGDVLELNFHGPDGEHIAEQDIEGGTVNYAESEDR